MNHVASFRLIAKCIAISGVVLVASGSSCATSGEGAVVEFVAFPESTPSQRKRAEERHKDDARSRERARQDQGSCFFERERKSAAEERVVTVIQPHLRRDYGSDSDGGC